VTAPGYSTAPFSAQPMLGVLTTKPRRGSQAPSWAYSSYSPSGHVDDFARFAPRGRVLICHEPKKSDSNYAPLRSAARALRGATNARGKKLEIVQLPMPDPVFYDGERLPASYANFYVCNAAVLVPVFNDRHDQEALSIIGSCFTDRPVVGIYARDLVVGLGTLHCSTMQEPAF
jgi:agmatine deiminase